MTLARTAILALLTFVAAAGVRAAEPASQPSGIDVREWAVFVVDGVAQRANARDAWPSSLPPFIESRRAGAADDDAARAMPVGIIHLLGTLDSKTPTDVSLAPPGGEFEGSWPRGQSKPAKLLWANLVPAAAADDLEELKATDWLAPIRSAGGASLKAGAQAETFLLYDVSLPWKPALTIKSQDGGFAVSSDAALPLRNVTLYKKRDGRWTQATLGTLPGKESAKPAPTTVASDPAAVFDQLSPRSTTKPTATTTATAAPTSARAAPTVQLTDPGVPDAAALLAPWKPILTEAGVPAGDIDIVLRTVADRGLDDRWLTVVYLLDPAEMDRLLPLGIIPAPRRISRVGLVVVRGLDPTIVDEIDRLIVQCGDNDYTVRKAATAALIAIGEPAKAKLEKARTNADVEIAQRAEMVLAKIGKKKDDE